MVDTNGQKFLGVTQPISLSPPTHADLESTKNLEEALRTAGQFESDSLARKREQVLGRLSQLIQEFVYRVSIASSMPEALAREAGGKIFTFGSYRLGAHNAGSDIDTLCVAPKHVKREDFFETMYEMLKNTKEVTELTKVEDAYVPLIKMSFSGVDIDLVFARLALSAVPQDLDLREDNLLKNLDERCIRSLNGSRVTDEILRLVPNVESFRLSLKCIKLWAKNRAIYSNVMGFLGGVAWAMLVARICQLYPKASAGTIVSKFFRIMYQWKWPQPVLLKQIDEGPLQVRVWNPKLYPADRGHRMPVITPAYPSMCATHNVTASNQKIITTEFSRAADIVDKVAIGMAQWPELWEKHDFFSKYRHYLQIIASSNSEEVQLKWSGMVESRVRQLVMKLETVEILLLAHPYIKGIEKIHHCRTLRERYDAGRGIKSAPKEDEEDGEDEEPSTVYTTTFYIGLLIQPKTQGSTGTRRLDLSFPVKAFMDLVTAWEHYDEKVMHIEVNNMKSSLLSPDVLGEGCPLPTSLKRTKSSPKRESLNSQPSKKQRSSSDGSSEAADPVNDSPMKSNGNDVKEMADENLKDRVIVDKESEMGEKMVV